MSRRSWLLVIPILAILVVTAACGGSTTDAEEGAPDADAPVATDTEDDQAPAEASASANDRPAPTPGVATIEVDGRSMTFPVELICSIADFNVFFQFESEDGIARLAAQIHMAENGDFILRHDTRVTEGYVVSVSGGEGLDAELKEMTFEGPAIKVAEVYGTEPGEDVGTAVITAACT